MILVLIYFFSFVFPSRPVFDYNFARFGAASNHYYGETCHISEDGDFSGIDSESSSNGACSPLFDGDSSTHLLFSGSDSVSGMPSVRVSLRLSICIAFVFISCTCCRFCRVNHVFIFFFFFFSFFFSLLSSSSLFRFRSERFL